MRHPYFPQLEDSAVNYVHCRPLPITDLRLSTLVHTA
jgi:hypothetical protein